ncbi:major facilitator superfamily domain-containing protein, partial [Dactylonectria estremocensis]
MATMDKPEEQYVENGQNDDIMSTEHREFLLKHHGTVELDPMPSMDEADPLNWPNYKKIVNLIIIAFHAMMATFTAAAIQSAYVDIAADLNVSVQRATYLTSLVIAIIGAAPLLWRPLSHAYGRRPIFLLSLSCSAICNVGCALSHSYATMGLCRALTAFFISPAASIGSAVVSETFFSNQRGRYIGIWTAMVTLGVPVAPFIFGFVALRVGYRWIYWILAMINAVQLLVYFCFGPETRYVPGQKTNKPSSTLHRYLGFRRIDPTPLTLKDFVQPLFFITRLCVVIPAVAHAMVFLWGSVVITIEIPQLYPEKFGFNTQQVGLQNVGPIVGTILGEQIGGVLSDRWMWLRQRNGVTPRPEFRLWVSYFGHLLTICGVVVFLVQTERASDTWNPTPIVGAAIAGAGNQIVTTVMMTYAVDCYRPDASGIGVFITLVRQTWGFIGPFWFPELLENVGLAPSAGVATAMIVGVTMIPTALLQWKGYGWRRQSKSGTD